MKIGSATRRDTGTMVYTVQSDEDPNHYHIVWREPDGFHCSCKSFKFGRKGHCKHTNAVKYEIMEAMEYIGAKWMPPMKARRPLPAAKPAAARRLAKRQTCSYCHHEFDRPVKEIETGERPVCQRAECQRQFGFLLARRKHFAERREASILETTPAFAGILKAS